jgi:hypothetical protein
MTLPFHTLTNQETNEQTMTRQKYQAYFIPVFDLATKEGVRES